MPLGMPLQKTWINLFSLQLWVNSRADGVYHLGMESSLVELWIQTSYIQKLIFSDILPMVEVLCKYIHKMICVDINKNTCNDMCMWLYIYIIVYIWYAHTHKHTHTNIYTHSQTHINKHTNTQTCIYGLFFNISYSVFYH